jgi:V/A-type H+-transporting ATPase subunit A
MEEIPGEEAFPAYLDSTIKAVYERAGVIRGPDGATGSLTMIGTVSPAGGNFEEPVTQATLATVKCFLGLSSERAYRRCYPAIDPLLSWSRYREQLSPWFDAQLGAGWVARVERIEALLRRGDGIHQMMQVVGEEGVTIDDFISWQKATLIDAAYLQQDAFDAVDVSVSLDQQKRSFELIERIVSAPLGAAGDRDALRRLFTQLTSELKNLNYSSEGSPEQATHRRNIDALLTGQRASP